MAAEEPWTIDAANDADIAEQTIPVNRPIWTPRRPSSKRFPHPASR